jgi:hypothetical protein
MLGTDCAPRSADHFRHTYNIEKLSSDIALEPGDEPPWFLLKHHATVAGGLSRNTDPALCGRLTGPEIAMQIGLTYDSVRVNLHRGVKLLRE